MSLALALVILLAIVGAIAFSRVSAVKRHRAVVDAYAAREIDRKNKDALKEKAHAQEHIVGE